MPHDIELYINVAIAVNNGIKGILPKPFQGEFEQSGNLFTFKTKVCSADVCKFLDSVHMVALGHRMDTIKNACYMLEILREKFDIFLASKIASDTMKPGDVIACWNNNRNTAIFLSQIKNAKGNLVEALKDTITDADFANIQRRIAEPGFYNPAIAGPNPYNTANTTRIHLKGGLVREKAPEKNEPEKKGVRSLGQLKSLFNTK
jgi:hypothetical protein